MFELTIKQKEFWNNANHRWNIKTGATRSGKTWLDYYMIPRRIRERVNKEGIVLLLGNTQATLWRNILEPMQKLYGNKLVGNLNSQNQIYLFGETCYALGADKITQVERIQGSSVKYCYGDEIATWNKEVFEMLKSRLDKSYSCFDGTLNPEHKNHWFKKDFLDKAIENNLDVYVQKYTIDDNPMLDPKFVEELKKEYQATVYYNRFILGEWTNAEGLLFQQLANNPKEYEWNVNNEKDLIFPLSNIGLDIGGTKSNTSIVITGVSYGWKNIVTYGEDIIKHEKGSVDVEMICERLKTFILTHNKNYIKAVFVDNAEQVILNTIRRFLINNNIKINVFDCKKFDGKTRILQYNLLLNTNRMWFYKVPKTIEALTTAVYDEKTKEDKILDDFTSDIDTFDAHFYSFSSYLEYLQKGV